MKKIIPKLKNWQKDFLWGNLFGLLFQIALPFIIVFGFPAMNLSLGNNFFGNIFIDMISGWGIAFISFLVEPHTFMMGIKALPITIIFWGLVGIVFGLAIRKTKNRRKL